MEQTLVEQPVQQSEDPLPAAEEPPSAGPVPDPAKPRCTVDCKHCSIATLIGGLSRAKSLDERETPKNEPNKYKHAANAVRQQVRKEFLTTVTIGSMRGGSPKVRMKVVTDVAERYELCHHEGAEQFHDDISHLLTVSAPSKIRAESFDAHA